jgi:hypothetical protein
LVWVLLELEPKGGKKERRKRKDARHQLGQEEEGRGGIHAKQITLNNPHALFTIHSVHEGVWGDFEGSCRIGATK